MEELDDLKREYEMDIIIGIHQTTPIPIPRNATIVSFLEI